MILPVVNEDSQVILHASVKRASISVALAIVKHTPLTERAVAR